MEQVAFKILARLLEGSQGALHRLIDKKGIPFWLPGVSIKADGALLDLTVLGEEGEEAATINVGMDVPHVDLPRDVVLMRCGTRARVRVRVLVVLRRGIVVVEGSGGAGGSELAGGHAVVDELLGTAESAAGGASVAEENEAVALGSAAGLVDDHAAIVDVAVADEGGAEALSGGVPAEAVNKELAVDRVEVGDAADLGEGCRVGGCSEAEEADETVPGDRLQEIPHVVVIVILVAFAASAAVLVVRGRRLGVDDGLLVELGEGIIGMVWGGGEEIVLLVDLPLLGRHGRGMRIVLGFGCPFQALKRPRENDMLAEDSVLYNKQRKTFVLCFSFPETIKNTEKLMPMDGNTSRGV